MKKQPTSASDVWIPDLNLKLADKDIIENNQELNEVHGGCISSPEKKIS